MPIERRRVRFWGRVQGVGFRATTRQLAEAFPVAGHVRNLSDGRVELLVEGESSSIAGFLDAVADAMGDNIHGSLVDDEPPGHPPLDGFTIRS